MVLVPEPRGSGWRIHCGVEVTESSTNIQHALVFLVFRVLFLVFRVLVGLQAHPCSLCSSPFCLCLYKKITQPGFACVRASLLCLCALISYMNMCVCVCLCVCVCVLRRCPVTSHDLFTPRLKPTSTSAREKARHWYKYSNSKQTYLLIDGSSLTHRLQTHTTGVNWSPYLLTDGRLIVPAATNLVLGDRTGGKQEASGRRFYCS